MILPNLQFIKSIPVWGPRLYEAFNAVQQQTSRIETQGNLNATGEPPVPPPPDALNVTNGPSGEYQIAITHNGEFNRGTSFHVQWDTSPHFTNPHNIDLGASRNDSSLYLPGQTAHFRASTASPSGANSAWTYHGSQNRPTPVIGGVRGVRAPGMGSGTGAPGDQSGGPGPIQARNHQAGYDWKAQQRTAGAGVGASAQGTPAGAGASAISGGGGGGGGITLSETQIAAAETLTTIAGTGNAITGVTVPAYSARALDFVIRYIPIHDNSGATTINENGIGAVAITKNGTSALVGGELVTGKTYFLMWDGTEYQIVGILAPISATVLASDSHGVPIAAVLSTGKIWIGSAGNLPVAQTPSGDISVTAGGVVTVTGVNGAAVPSSAALVGTNSSGQIIPASASVFSTASFLPVIQIGGSATGVTFTYTATSSNTGTGTGAPVTVVINITITGWPVLPSGTVTIGGLPVNAGAKSVGTFAAVSGFVGLSAGVSVIPVLLGTTITLDTQGTTGVATLPAATIANGSVFAITVTYQSA